MNTDEETMNWVTEQIIACAFIVHNALDYGFAELVYKDAHELRKRGLQVEREKELLVFYDGIVVGKYFADMIVDGLVLVEAKAVQAFDDAHMALCRNYLDITKLPICLLLNFGRKVEIKRLRR